MKLIIKEYISSLNEEIGLNELIPKLYLLNGYTVVNNAQKGVRQNGVDILAEKSSCPYLITIKQGSIKRENWNNDPTSLRQTLDDIVDAYIPNNLPQKYKGKKIHIDIVLNGYVDQAVQNSLTGYEKRYNKYKFNVLNLDTLTDMVYNSLLNENLFSMEDASKLRKCLVLINEKDFNISVFDELSNSLIDRIIKTNSLKNLKREIRKIILIQNIICNWDCESNVNINKIKCCESLILKIVTKVLKLNKNKKEIDFLFNSILQSYIEILEKYFNNVESLKHTCRALPIFDEFGHKLKLFEILGILSLNGLLLLDKYYYKDEYFQKIENIRNMVIDILENYDGTSYIPLESNCSEISLILLFLYRCGDIESARNYAISLLKYQAINYRKFKRFPYPYDDYYEALKNQETNDEEFTSSLVIECLYEWLILLGGFDNKYLEVKLITELFKDVSMQSWSFDEDEEVDVLQGNRMSGCCYVMPKFVTVKQYKKVLKLFIKGIDYKKYFLEKKNISFASLIASRLYRLPVNPYHYLKDLR